MGRRRRSAKSGRRAAQRRRAVHGPPSPIARNRISMRPKATLSAVETAVETRLWDLGKSCQALTRAFRIARMRTYARSSGEGEHRKDVTESKRIENGRWRLWAEGKPASKGRKKVVGIEGESAAQARDRTESNLKARSESTAEERPGLRREE